MKTVKELVQAYAPHAIEMRCELHKNPELGYQEFQTTELIRRELTSYGIEIQELDGVKTGLTAVIRGGRPGKTVGIREDIDALPLVEETGLPCASVNGSAHACGHDIHCASQIGRAHV